MTRPSRTKILDRLRRTIAAGEPVIGTGAGIGLSAKCEELAGAHFIIIYSSGRFRMAGRPSNAGLLAYGNANRILLDMANEILPVVRETPVIAGIPADRPLLVWVPFLDDLKRMGFAGVQNYPTIGRIDGDLRATMEQTGLSYRREVETIYLRHKADLLTTPYVFSSADAQAMAAVGADILVCHLGLTAGGHTGAQTTMSLDEWSVQTGDWTAAGKAVRTDVIVLCHGGPTATPDDVSYILRNTPTCHGFYGESSIERLPAE